ncbi:MAG TPA: TIGR03936 family radical SAM-associated protein [bacterium]|nr:TIGR03936 family radical SAM-associated protein [bacterium]HOL66857.1 TIGR03936 family radical SAM-associated protein [bacterium]HPP11293.1 TIGR03936 family radical SAM-associated protein [bacterium]
MKQQTYRLRVFYEKRGVSVVISQKDFAKIIERTLRRVDFPFKFSEGFHPRPRLSFGPPLPVNIAGLNEAFEVYAVRSIDEQELLDRVNSILPRGTHFHRAGWVMPSLPSLVESAVTATYILKGNPPPAPEEIAVLGEVTSAGENHLQILVNLKNFTHAPLKKMLGFLTVERIIHWSNHEKIRGTDFN